MEILSSVCRALVRKRFSVNAELSFVQTFDKCDKRSNSFVTWSVNGGSRYSRES